MQLTDRVGKGGLFPLILVLALVLLGIRLVWQYALPINHDVAFSLDVGGKLLDGQRLYTDILDPNPPFMYWFAIPPNLLSRLFNLGLKPAFFIWFYALAGLSFWLCWRQMKRRLSDTNERITALLLMVLLFIGFPATAYGQREHVLIILFLPYLLSAINRAEGHPSGPVPERLLIGFLAAAGMMMKIFSFIIWFGLELYLFLSDRKRSSCFRAECFGFGGTIAAGMIALLLLTPQYIEFTRVSLATYTSINHSPLQIIFARSNIVWPLLVIAFFIDRALGRPPHARRILFITGTLGFICAMLQMKGWGYHFIPGVGIALWAFTLSIYRFLRHILDKKGVAAGARIPAVLVIAAMLAFTFLNIALSDHLYNVEREVIDLVRAHAQGEPIYFLAGIWMAPVWSAVVEGEATWPVGLADMFNIHAHYPPGSMQKLRKPSEMDENERLFFEIVLTGMLARPPRLLFTIDPQEGHFPYIGYFRQDPRFETFWQRYDLLTVIHDESPEADIRSFLVYKRRD